MKDTPIPILHQRLHFGECQSGGLTVLVYMISLNQCLHCIHKQVVGPYLLLCVVFMHVKILLGSLVCLNSLLQPPPTQPICQPGMRSGS